MDRERERDIHTEKQLKRNRWRGRDITNSYQLSF